MSLPLRRTSLTAIAVVAALASAGTATAGATARATVPVGGALAPLTTNVLPHISELTGTPTAASTVLSLGVTLARPNPAGENAALAAMYDAKSPSYHQFMTPASFAAEFGVPQARIDAVTTLLKNAGISVLSVSSDGSYISASGTVAQTEKAFGVTENDYVLTGQHFFANTAAPMVPSLDGITTITGLNSLQKFKRLGSTAAPSALPQQDTCLPAVGCTGATTPQDLWSIYDQPANYTGKGQRIAIIGEGDPTNIIKDLRVGEKAYGLPTTPITVDCVVGNNCGTDTSGDGEWQIDTQASLGMAPDADGETLYFAQSVYDPSLNNAFIAWAQDPTGPSIASASLGECEGTPANGVFASGPLSAVDGNLTGGIAGTMGLTAPVGLGDGEQTTLEPIFKQAVMEGKTLFAPTGDTGSSCPVVYAGPLGGLNGVANQGVPLQNYPGVSTYAVAVGGTVPYTNDNGEGAGTTYKAGQPAATRSLETAWDEGGGGASPFIPAPSWQAPVAAIIQPCILSLDGSTTATGKQCRGVPDIAAQSGDTATNGYSLGTANSDGSSSFTQGAGTSLASPLAAGMWARVLGAAGKPLGFAAPLLYKSGTDTAADARDFNDITVGANGLHQALPGWDYTTGFGTLQVDGLICDIDGKPSGRFAAAGVAGVCPLVAASTGTVSVAATAATKATAAKAGAAKKAAAKKAAAKKAAAKQLKQPTNTLAFTGLDGAVPVGALVLLVGAGVAARRRRSHS